VTTLFLNRPFKHRGFSACGRAFEPIQCGGPPFLFNLSTCRRLFVAVIFFPPSLILSPRLLCFGVVPFLFFPPCRAFSKVALHPLGSLPRYPSTFFRRFLFGLRLLWLSSFFESIGLSAAHRGPLTPGGACRSSSHHFGVFPRLPPSLTLLIFFFVCPQPTKLEVGSTFAPGTPRSLPPLVGGGGFVPFLESLVFPPPSSPFVPVPQGFIANPFLP